MIPGDTGLPLHSFVSQNRVSQRALHLFRDHESSREICVYLSEVMTVKMDVIRYAWIIRLSDSSWSNRVYCCPEMS